MKNACDHQKHYQTDDIIGERIGREKKIEEKKWANSTTENELDEHTTKAMKIEKKNQSQ